jgi:hypothetical protein
MQTLLALHKGPELHCTASVENDQAPRLRIEITCTMQGFHLRNVYHIGAIKYTIEFYAVVQGARLETAIWHNVVLALYLTKHGFGLRIPCDTFPNNTSELDFSANQILEILQVLCTTCAEYPSMVQGLTKLMDWVKQ